MAENNQDKEIKDTKAIEEKALNYLNSFIEDSRVISQFIDDNDKEPCWDGHLYLYSDGKRDKEHLRGRVPIQIKGTEVERFQTKKWKFKLEKNDLKAYLHEPTFFIVCQIKKNSKERKLFFRELLPETVNRLLRDIGPNETRKTLFHPLTTDLHEFEEQLGLFLAHSRKMVSFADSKPLTLEDVRTKGIRDFTFIVPYNTSDKLKLFKYLSTHDTYLYAKLSKEFDIDVPISGGPMKFSFQRDLDVDVKAGDRVFYHGCKNRIEDGRLILTIDNVMTIDLPMDDSDKQKPEVKFRGESKTLLDSIHEAEFSIALHESGTLSIGDLDLHLKVNEVDFIERLKENLVKWKELQALLDKLHVTKPLDLTGITKKQGYHIDLLVETILKGKPVKVPGQKSTLMIFDISNVKLLLWCAANENGDCMFGDFCDHTIEISYKPEDRNIIVSPYSYLQNERLWELCDNIIYDDIVPSAEKVCSKDSFCYQMANYDVLSLIKASDNILDSDEDKSLKLLGAAADLCHWLIENDPNIDFHLIHLVNKYQIIKRQRPLNEAESQELDTYLQSDETTKILKAGICLLLERKELFEELFNSLQENEQTEMKNYPIWKFKNW